MHSTSLVAAFRRRRARDPRSIALNVVPLVDVTFLLMIFFVIAGSFEILEGVMGSRMLPTGPGFGVPLPVSPIVVRLENLSIDDSFHIRIEGFPEVTRNFLELADHLARIQKQPGFDALTPVVIAASDEIEWDHVVNAWNAAIRAKFTNVAFAEP